MNRPTTTAPHTGSAELAELIEKLSARLRAGEPIDWEEVERNHPALAAEARRLLPTLEQLAELSGASADPSTGGSIAPLALGDYRIVREVGRGGMGVVYEAEQLSLGGRRVALKVLPFAAVADSRHLQRFKNEALTAASLDHPHVVRVVGVGCDRGVHYIAMQFIDGRSLAEFIRERRGEVRPAAAPGPTRVPIVTGHDSTRSFTPDATSAPAVAAPARGSTSRTPADAAYVRRVAEWGVQAADALEHAHSLGVVHRDVKPGNLLVDARGNLFVADFGLAKLAADPGVTGTGDLLGTLRYMSPEQAGAKHDLVDHRSDVYSLGATLYELLTLAPAIDGGSRAEILRKITDTDPPPPRKLDRGVPRDLETVVLKAMDKDPARRYQSAKDLAADLRRVLSNEPVRARRATLLDRATKWARRNQAAVVATLMAALVVLPASAGSVGWAVRDRAQRRADAERDEAMRRAEVERRLDAGLAEVEGLHARGRWTAAREAVGGLEPLMESGVEGSRQDRLLGWRADLDMVARLAEIQTRRTAARTDPPDDQWVDQEYAGAFREYGIDVEGLDPGRAAELIAARPVRAELAAALDDWAAARLRVHKADGEASWVRLLGIARSADADETRVRIRDALLQRDLGALQAAADGRSTAELPPGTLRALAVALWGLGDREGALAVLRQGQLRHPGDFWMNYDLGQALRQMSPPRLEEALRFFTAAASANPLSLMARINVGYCLLDLGKPVEAEAYCREAIRLKPHFPELHNSLGIVFSALGRYEEAVACHREAIRLKPDFAAPHTNLGLALKDLGRYEEAVACYREAIRLKPNFAGSHSDLGVALNDLGRYEEAVACHREAIRLKPDFAAPHTNLGLALKNLGRYEEAVACHREAIRLKPDLVQAHFNLGLALVDLGKPGEAVPCYQEAIRLRPDFTDAHYSLGNAFSKQGKPAEAEAYYREAIRLTPGFAEAHCNLGAALRALGRFEESLPAYRRGHELGSQRKRWPYPSGMWVKQAERYVVLYRKVPRVASGEEKPADLRETLALADVARLGRWYATSAKLYSEVFLLHPVLARLGDGARYNAACSAALAGCGRGEDADKLGEDERRALRQRALLWLRAELSVWSKQAANAAGAPKVRDALRHWHVDPDLAPVREESELKKLPEAEQDEWRELWAAVAGLRDRLEPALAPPPRPVK